MHRYASRSHDPYKVTNKILFFHYNCRSRFRGPLVCRSEANHMEFYLPGIISSGDNPSVEKQEDVHCGQPNTFTTFTRMSKK